MGTTIWVDDETRQELRRLQAALRTASANETIRRLIAQPAADATSIFAAHRPAIRAIMRRHGIKRLVAFGSRARGEARPDSDLDLAVELRKDARPLALLAAEADLEEALGMEVTLVGLPNARLNKVIEKEGVRFAS